MKKVLIVGILSIGLVSCGEPIPKDQWLRDKNDLKAVSGFEDCFIAELKRSTNSNPLIIVRCSNSTSSLNYTVQNGKSSYNQTVITDSSVVDHRVAQLEQQIREQDELIRKQQESLRTSLAIIKKEGN